MPIDLNNPEHIHQLLSNYLAEKRPDLSEFDKGDSSELLNDALKGIDSAQYFTGHKKNEVETFYDAHPVQATIHDLLNKAPVLAGGAVAGQAGHSMLKDYLLQRDINKTKNSYKKKDGFDPSNQRFPKGVEGSGSNYEDLYSTLERSKPKLEVADDNQLIRTLSKNFPTKSLSKGKGNKPARPDIKPFKTIVEELGKRNPVDSAAIARKASRRAVDPLRMVKNLGSHVNPRMAAIAGGIGLGGMALSPLVSFLQKQVYGKPKVKEWLTNRRMTEGKFE